MSTSCACPLSPASLDAIYKNECALCFRLPSRLEVCLECGEAFCPVHLSAHGSKHPSHHQFVVVEWTEPSKVAAEEPSNKQPRLEGHSLVIPADAETGKDQRSQSYSYSCHRCSSQVTDFSQLPSAVAERCRLIASCEDAAEQAQRTGDAWTEPSAVACEHSLLIAQEPPTTGEALMK